MRVIREIPISQVYCGYLKLCPQTLDLAKKMEKGLIPPPIKVNRVKFKHAPPTYHICDGRHRLTAHKLLGHKTIRAKFFIKD